VIAVGSILMTFQKVQHLLPLGRAWRFIRRTTNSIIKATSVIIKNKIKVISAFLNRNSHNRYKWAIGLALVLLFIPSVCQGVELVARNFDAASLLPYLSIIGISGIFVISWKKIKSVIFNFRLKRFISVWRHFSNWFNYPYAYKRIKIIYSMFRHNDTILLRLNLFIFGIITIKNFISTIADNADLRALIARQIGEGQAGKSLLSIGPGSGILEKTLIEDYGLEVTGIDLTKAVLKRAKKNGVRAELGDGQKLPVRNEKFDSVIFIETIGHMDIRKALHEAFSVLKPGGKVYIATYTSTTATSRRYKYRSDTLGDLTNILEKIGFGDVHNIPIDVSDYLLVQAVKPVEAKTGGLRSMLKLKKVAQTSI